MRTNNVSALALLFCAVAAIWCSVASAQTNLGPPIISGDCVPTAGGSSTCGSLTESAYDVAGEVYSSLSLNTTANGLLTGNVHNTLQFEVLGPTGGSATLDLNASASTSFTPSGGGGSAEAEVTLVNPAVGMPILNQYACSNNYYQCQLSLTPSGSPSLSIANYSFTVPTNTVINLSTELFYYEDNGATLSASIDPNVTFAPSFNSNGDTLIYSADTVSPVPLPASFWLLLSGLGGLGVMARNHRAA